MAANGRSQAHANTHTHTHTRARTYNHKHQHKQTNSHTRTHFTRGPASMFALMSLIRTVAHANKQLTGRKGTTTTTAIATRTTNGKHQRQLVLVNDLIKFSPIPQRSSSGSILK